MTTETFAGVFLCNGHHDRSFVPHIDGRELFRGKQLHSSEYRTWKGFEDKRVLVVGMGVSACEIACELSQVCSQVIISTRRGAWIVGRLAEFGIPYDLMYNRQVVKLLFRLLPNWLTNYFFVTLLNLKFDHQLYAAEPDHAVVSQNALINDDLPTALATGKIRLRGDIDTLTEDGVVFKDGTKEEGIDVVIFATGYNFAFPFLKDKVLKLANGQTELYKFVFSHEIQPPTLAVIGCMEPFGPVMPVSELQSRWAARVVRGTTKLPSMERMTSEIERRNRKIKKHYLPSMRHRIHYDFVTHMDDLAEEIGCKPKYLTLLLTDPRLAFSVFFGPSLPFHYRLFGPGKWPPARQAIFGVWDRIAAPMKTRRVVTGSWRSVAVLVKFLIVLMALLWFGFIVVLLRK